MPSRKGKGRQCGGFERKSQRAQFQKEWQSNLQKVQAKRRQQQKQLKKECQRNHLVVSKPTSLSGAGSRQTFASQLRRMIAERQHFDRLEDRTLVHREAAQVRRKQAEASGVLATSPPGWILYHNHANDEEEAADDDFGKDFRRPQHSVDKMVGHKKRRLPTLQALCLEAFAAVVPEYYDALGDDVLHGYLSLLPGPALSVLSVLVSSQHNGGMTNGFVKVIGQHTHVTRLCIVAPRHCDETDPRWKALEPSVALPPLLPAFGTDKSQNILWNTGGRANQDLIDESGDEQLSQQPILLPILHHRHDHQVPATWEDLASDSDDDAEPTAGSINPCTNHLASATFLSPSPCMVWTGCRALERLELGHSPTLTFELVEQMLPAWGETLTHLGLSGSLSWEHGAEVLWKLPLWLPHLQVLDVSGNGSWVTEPLLRHLYEVYNLRDDPANYYDQANKDDEDRSSARPQNDAEGVSTFSDGRLSEDPAGADNQEHQTSPSLFGPSTLRLDHHKRRSKRSRPLVIKATGCLSRSSQMLLEMEFGTIF